MPATRNTNAENRYRYWILTIPYADWSVPTDATHMVPAYIAGQQEIGESGYHHWQLVAYYKTKQRMGTVKSHFANTAHVEHTYCDAARDYVWKEDTAVAGTRFELGTVPFRRNSSTDWAAVRNDAVRGRFSAIPDNIYVQHYGNLRRIAADNLAPTAIVSTATVYWGPTGVGKSRRAWFEAGLEAYPKDPRTKWWCGYAGQRNVIFDEFRGDIAISHLLRWLDRYPVLLETKGSTTVKQFDQVWFTSNLHPRDWYPDLDEITKEALYRRLNIIEMTDPWEPPNDGLDQFLVDDDEVQIDVDNLINLLND